MTASNHTQQHIYAFPIAATHLQYLMWLILLVDFALIAANFILALKPWLLPPFLQLELNMDQEAVFGAWYPSMLLFCLGLVALLNFNLDRLRTPGIWCYGWFGLIVVPILLSADEVSAIHERIGLWFGEKVGGISFLPQAYAWVLILAPFILATAVYYGVFFLKRFRGYPWTKAGTLLGLGFWGLAVTFESIANVVFDGDTINIERAFEESFELIGTTLFLITLARFAILKASQPLSSANAVQPSRSSAAEQAP